MRSPFGAIKNAFSVLEKRIFPSFWGVRIRYVSGAVFVLGMTVLPVVRVCDDSVYLEDARRL